MSFIKEMLTAETGKSSKRMVATVLILINLIYTGYIVYIGDVTQNVLNLIQTVFYIGLLLFGTTTVDKLVKPK